MRTGLSMKTFWASLAVLALLAAGAAYAGPLAPQPRIVAKYDRASSSAPERRRSRNCWTRASSATS